MRYDAHDVTPDEGYLWLIQFRFPFIAYVQLLQSLKKRPMEGYAEKAWEIMSDNYAARFMGPGQVERALFIVFSRNVLQACGSA